MQHGTLRYMGNNVIISRLFHLRCILNFVLLCAQVQSDLSTKRTWWTEGGMLNITSSSRVSKTNIDVLIHWLTLSSENSVLCICMAAYEPLSKLWHTEVGAFITPRVVRQWSIIKILAGLRTKNDCAGENQHQFTRQTCGPHWRSVSGNSASAKCL